MAEFPRSDALIADIRREFPRFAIVYKRDSRLQRSIHVALAIVTLGGQRRYATHYHTAMFGKLFVPDSWARMADDDRTILLRHERVHLQQRRRMGDVVMALVYLLPILPLGLAWGRARIEWEAYEETIRATVEIQGEAAARALRPEIVRRYVSADYGWMWPFPRTIERWFDDALGRIVRECGNPARSG